MSFTALSSKCPYRPPSLSVFGGSQLPVWWLDAPESPGGISRRARRWEARGVVAGAGTESLHASEVHPGKGDSPLCSSREGLFQGEDVKPHL